MRDDIIAIVCPDVHGRNFWEQVAEEYDGSVPFIFLGDYVDPYDFEGIDEKTALNTLYKVWHFKCAHKDSVVTLIGNHDICYYDKTTRRVRYCYEIEGEVSDLLTTFFDHFKFAYEIEHEGMKFLFTHAGVHPKWFEEYGLEKRYDADYINDLYKKDPDSFYQWSMFRGCKVDITGSPIWADIREFRPGYNPGIEFPDNIMQIVGHTQLRSDKIEYPYICDIDSRQVFVITKDHRIEPYYNMKTPE